MESGWVVYDLLQFSYTYFDLRFFRHSFTCYVNSERGHDLILLFGYLSLHNPETLKLLLSLRFFLY